MGGAIARAFAREEARVHLAGRTLAALDATAAEIAAGGGIAHTAVVDALDPQAVEAHADAVVAAGGSLDVSCNAISIPAVQGTPLVDLPLDDFMAPISHSARTHFLTATAAARRMIPQRSGVIVLLSSSAAQESRHEMGGFNLACTLLRRRREPDQQLARRRAAHTSSMRPPAPDGACRRPPPAGAPRRGLPRLLLAQGPGLVVGDAQLLVGLGRVRVPPERRAGGRSSARPPRGVTRRRRGSAATGRRRPGPLAHPAARGAPGSAAPGSGSAQPYRRPMARRARVMPLGPGRSARRRSWRRRAGSRPGSCRRPRPGPPPGWTGRRPPRPRARPPTAPSPRSRTPPGRRP